MKDVIIFLGTAFIVLLILDLIGVLFIIVCRLISERSKKTKRKKW